MGFKSLLGSPSPIPELCVVGKNEMGTTEDVICRVGGTADGKRVQSICAMEVSLQLV